MPAIPESNLRGMDAEVARRVMGLEHVDFYRYVRQKFGPHSQTDDTYKTWRARWMDEHKYQWPVEDIVEELGGRELMYWGRGEARVVPHYTTDGDHVMEVFDHVRRHGVYSSIEPEHGTGGANYRVNMWLAYTGARLAEATGPDLPFLVCSAALVAVGKLGDSYVHGTSCG